MFRFVAVVADVFCLLLLLRSLVLLLVLLSLKLRMLDLLVALDMFAFASAVGHVSWCLLLAPCKMLFVARCCPCLPPARCLTLLCFAVPDHHANLPNLKNNIGFALTRLVICRSKYVRGEHTRALIHCPH